MRIFLTGFMGSGKTFVGQQLAGKLGFDFFDMDAEIEKVAGKSIAAIFKEDGESCFRTYEKELLLRLSKKENAVIATGGGTPCCGENMKIIKKTGVSVYLKFDVDKLAERLEHIKHTRPLIASKNKDELYLFIAKTLKKREPCYMKADYVAGGKNANAENIVSLLFE